MFRDALSPRKDDAQRRDNRSVNVTPDLTPAPAARPQEAGAPPAPAKPEDSATSKLIVGPNIKLKGAEITDCDTLVVEGRVEAAMDSRVIKISEKGVFAGTAGIDTAEIYGQFEGELTARKQLIVHATGKVRGKVRYGTLKIEEGGEIAGDISAINAGPTPVSLPAQPKPESAAPDSAGAYEPFGRKPKPPQAAKP
jgi:cytoskeletal protein CcmA (bactofilin family)